MLIRKNTKAFKTIAEIILACQQRTDREKFIRLYITKAGHTVHDRISVEGIQGDAALFYEMNYQSVLNYLQSSNHQLHASDEIPGVYFFRSSSNKTWDENPFEFDESVKKEFSALPELPVVRKKEKAQKRVVPVGKSKVISVRKKEKTSSKKSVTVIPERNLRQPGYKLRHKIYFSELDKVVFRQPLLTKQNILDYYNKIAEYLLPYLKGRPLWTRLQTDKGMWPVELSVEGLFKDHYEQLPEWIQSVTILINKERKKMLLCNDKEHLLFYVERGCLEFSPCHSRIKSIDSPDYIVLVIDTPDGEPAKTTDVMAAARSVLQGLHLPSFLKTAGGSAFHAYVPLDSKSSFETSRTAAAYLCKLISLKIPDRISLKGIDGYVYGKASLDFSLNQQEGVVVAPFSLIAAEAPAISTPISWDEIEDHYLEHFNEEKIFKRLRQKGDPFKGLFKNKVNADSLVDRIEKHYAFLFS